MESVFEIIGPAMIGPSSSHTAGAIRIGRAARALFAAPPVRARFGLHGSFAATGRGHATDRALVAGLLGFATDDARMKDALDLAPGAGLAAVTFEAVDLGEQAHPNSARIEAAAADGETHTLVAASIGGGAIEVTRVDDFATAFQGNLYTLILWHQDRPGFLARVTTLMSFTETNIATLRTSRRHRGENALTVLEMDSAPPSAALALLNETRSVDALRLMAPL